MLVASLLMTAVVFMAPASTGEEAKARKTAEEILRLLDLDSNTAQMIDRMQENITQLFRREDQSAEDSEILARGMKRTLDLVAEEMSFAKMKDSYIDLYVQTFTPAELEGILAFYRSPIGTQFRQKLPQLMKASMDVSMSKTQELLPRIQEIVKQTFEESEAAATIEETVALMKSLSVAMEAYSVDHNRYPGPANRFVEISELEKELQPIYIKEVPLLDEWDTPLLVLSTGDKYWIVSAGPDGKFSRDYTALSDPAGELAASSTAPGDDIIAADGAFVSGVPAPHR